MDKKPAQLVFDEMVRRVAPMMKGAGFRRAGLSFRKAIGDRICVLTLQKSGSNARRTSYMTFYARAALVLPLLAQVEYPEFKSASCTEADGLWQASIHAADRDWKDWYVDAGTDPQVLAEAIFNGLEAVIRQFESCPDDRELLRQLLAKEFVPGGNSFRTAQFAFVLALVLGDAAAANHSSVAIRSEMARLGLPQRDPESILRELERIAQAV